MNGICFEQILKSQPSMLTGCARDFFVLRGGLCVGRSFGTNEELRYDRINCVVDE